MVRLGNIASENSLIRLLDTVLSSSLSTERKEQMLEQDFGIRPTIQRKGDMEEMCNLSSGLIEKGEKIGFERGIRTTAQRAYERFGSYEIAASLADVSVEQVKKWISNKDTSENADI